MNKTTQPPAAGETAHTPTPWKLIGDGIFQDHSPVSHLSENDISRVATVHHTFSGPDLLRNLTAKEQEAQANAAFIVRACNSHAALVAALEDTAPLAYELMERAAKIDRDLIAKSGREPDCELGEITRLRSQLSKARAALVAARA